MVMMSSLVEAKLRNWGYFLSVLRRPMDKVQSSAGYTLHMVTFGFEVNLPMELLNTGDVSEKPTNLITYLRTLNDTFSTESSTMKLHHSQ